MDATNDFYDINTSNERIKEILDSAETFGELRQIPNADQLTYSNGFYVNCTALFIDIRGSSRLTEKHTAPVLLKIYKAYVSECTAIINSDQNCRQLSIDGDCVSGIINTPLKQDINNAFSTAAKLCSIIKLLNWQFEKKGYTTIQCGIGMAYGKALMMKAGYKGSGINEVIWIKDVVNEASNLCHQGNRDYRKPLQVSVGIYNNLNDYNKNLLSPVFFQNSVLRVSQYEGDVINKDMDAWLENQKRVSSGLRLADLHKIHPSMFPATNTLAGIGLLGLSKR